MDEVEPTIDNENGGDSDGDSELGALKPDKNCGKEKTMGA